ncbi:MAG: hypothetical protein MK193_12600 [Lentisphaeria bacterium]|nr:hypothetical protein [Lentisphaeria bacterium]
MQSFELSLAYMKFDECLESNHLARKEAIPFMKNWVNKFVIFCDHLLKELSVTKLEQFLTELEQHFDTWQKQMGPLHRKVTWSEWH